MVGRQVRRRIAQRFCEQPGDVVLERATICSPTTASGPPRCPCAPAKSSASPAWSAPDAPSWRARSSAPTASSAARCRVNGQPLGRRPGRAVRAGVGLVPENRKTEGLALMRSVQDNVLVAGLRTLFPSGWYRARPPAAIVAATSSPGCGSRRRRRAGSTRFLSGGNQQKVVDRQVVHRRVAVLHLRRADARHRRRRQGRNLRRDRGARRGGAAVLMISSELAEIVAVCDRAYVMRDKTIVGELQRAAELSEENILQTGDASWVAASARRTSDYPCSSRWLLSCFAASSDRGFATRARTSSTSACSRRSCCCWRCR